jgi:hypothetical protein
VKDVLVSGGGEPAWKFIPSERDSETSPGAPNNPTSLLGTAKQQLKSIGELRLAQYFETGAAGRIIYNPAIDDRIFGTNNHFGHTRNSA